MDVPKYIHNDFVPNECLLCFVLFFYFFYFFLPIVCSNLCLKVFTELRNSSLKNTNFPSFSGTPVQTSSRSGKMSAVTADLKPLFLKHFEYKSSWHKSSIQKYKGVIRDMQHNPAFVHYKT